MPRLEKCEVCKGTGKSEGPSHHCFYCNGRGVFEITENPWALYLKVRETCKHPGAWMMGLLQESQPSPIGQAPVVRESYLLQFFTRVRNEQKVWQVAINQDTLDQMGIEQAASSILNSLDQHVAQAIFMP